MKLKCKVMVNWQRESFTEETLHLNIIPRGLQRVLLRKITFIVGLLQDSPCLLNVDWGTEHTFEDRGVEPWG